MAEGGLPEVASVTTYGLFGPAGIPPSVVARLNASVNESLKSEELRAAIRRIASSRRRGDLRIFQSCLRVK